MDQSDSDMSLVNKTLASANNPRYFNPLVVDETSYISGDNVAVSPGMFAYYFAVEKRGQRTEDITVVSVGSTNEQPGDTEGMTLQEWSSRLSRLEDPVKKRTHDYMLDQMLSKDGHRLHKFELSQTREEELEILHTLPRTKLLHDRAQQMIDTNQEKLESVLSAILVDKFGCN